MKMSTPSLVSKFASFLPSSINTYLLPHFLWENKKIHTHKSRKYRKVIHIEASTQITHPFAEAENKTLMLFLNDKQEK
jgi:hypothetical protein